MTKLSPVILFVYKRPALTLRTLRALKDNELAADTVLFIYADGPKADASDEDRRKIDLTRDIVRQEQWCKEIIIKEADSNMGLANSVINGVTEILNDHESVIVLEDDLVTAKGFLAYMNTALEKYRSDKKVMQVSGFNFPVKTTARNESYFLPFITSWGWGTWQRAWKTFDVNATGYASLKTNKKLRYRFNLQNSYPYSDMLYAQMETKAIDSWAIRWWWSVFKQNGIALYPDKTLVQNIGFGEDSTHTLSDDGFNSLTFSLEYLVRFFPEKKNIDNKTVKQITCFLAQRNGGSFSQKGRSIKRVLSSLINMARGIKSVIASRNIKYF